MHHQGNIVWQKHSHNDNLVTDQENIDRPVKYVLCSLLPLQNIQDHVSIIQTSDIGRHKQRVGYVYIYWSGYGYG